MSDPVRNELRWGERTCQQCGRLAAPALGPGAGPHGARMQGAGCGAFMQWLKKAVVEVSARENQDLVIRLALTSMASDVTYPLTDVQRAWIAALPQRRTPCTPGERARLKEPLITWVTQCMPTCEDILWQQFDKETP